MSERQHQQHQFDGTNGSTAAPAGMQFHNLPQQQQQRASTTTTSTIVTNNNSISVGGDGKGGSPTLLPVMQYHHNHAPAPPAASNTPGLIGSSEVGDGLFPQEGSRKQRHPSSSLQSSSPFTVTDSSSSNNNNNFADSSNNNNASTVANRGSLAPSWGTPVISSGGGGSNHTLHNNNSLTTIQRSPGITMLRTQQSAGSEIWNQQYSSSSTAASPSSVLANRFVMDMDQQQQQFSQQHRQPSSFQQHHHHEMAMPSPQQSPPTMNSSSGLLGRPPPAYHHNSNNAIAAPTPLSFMGGPAGLTPEQQQQFGGMYGDIRISPGSADSVATSTFVSSHSMPSGVGAAFFDPTTDSFAATQLGLSNNHYGGGSGGFTPDHHQDSSLFAQPFSGNLSNNPLIQQHYLQQVSSTPMSTPSNLPKASPHSLSAAATPAAATASSATATKKRKAASQVCPPYDLPSSIRQLIPQHTHIDCELTDVDVSPLLDVVASILELEGIPPSIYPLALDEVNAAAADSAARFNNNNTAIVVTVEGEAVDVDKVVTALDNTVGGDTLMPSPNLGPGIEEEEATPKLAPASATPTPKPRGAKRHAGTYMTLPLTPTASSPSATALLLPLRTVRFYAPDFTRVFEMPIHHLHSTQGLINHLVDVTIKGPVASRSRLSVCKHVYDAAIKPWLDSVDALSLMATIDGEPTTLLPSFRRTTAQARADLEGGSVSTTDNGEGQHYTSTTRLKLPEENSVADFQPLPTQWSKAGDEQPIDVYRYGKAMAKLYGELNRVMWCPEGSKCANLHPHLIPTTIPVATPPTAQSLIDAVAEVEGESKKTEEVERTEEEEEGKEVEGSPNYNNTDTTNNDDIGSHSADIVVDNNAVVVTKPIATPATNNDLSPSSTTHFAPHPSLAWSTVHANTHAASAHLCFNAGFEVPIAAPNELISASKSIPSESVFVTRGALRYYLNILVPENNSTLPPLPPLAEKVVSSIEDEKQQTKGHNTGKSDPSAIGTGSAVTSGPSSPLLTVPSPPKGIPSSDDEAALASPTSITATTTTVADNTSSQRTVLQHCAHFSKNGMCALGAECLFVHAVGYSCPMQPPTTVAAATIPPSTATPQHQSNEDSLSIISTVHRSGEQVGAAPENTPVFSHVGSEATTRQTRSSRRAAAGGTPHQQQQSNFVAAVPSYYGGAALHSSAPPPPSFYSSNGGVQPPYNQQVSAGNTLGRQYTTQPQPHPHHGGPPMYSTQQQMVAAHPFNMQQSFHPPQQQLQNGNMNFMPNNYQQHVQPPPPPPPPQHPQQGGVFGHQSQMFSGGQPQQWGFLQQQQQPNGGGGGHHQQFQYPFQQQ